MSTKKPTFKDILKTRRGRKRIMKALPCRFSRLLKLSPEVAALRDRIYREIEMGTKR